MLSCFNHVQLFVIPWSVAHQAPLSMDFSWEEYWSQAPGDLLPPGDLPPGNLPDRGIKPTSLKSSALAGGFLPVVPPGKPIFDIHFLLSSQTLSSAKVRYGLMLFFIPVFNKYFSQFQLCSAHQACSKDKDKAKRPLGVI